MRAVIRFFGTGHGRSGTLWLARLLNEDDSVEVYHEPGAAYDRSRYNKVFYRALDAEKHIRRRRTNVINNLMSDDKDYAEVSSYLRYSIKALCRVEQVPVFMIIRDGRYVVRSMLAGEAFYKTGYPPFTPPPSVDAITPFEKACWYWAKTYRYLSDSELPFVPVYSLEQLNEDWELAESLFRYAQVNISHETWVKYAHQIINGLVSDPEPPEWDYRECQAFNRLAGDIQERFGYPLPVC